MAIQLFRSDQAGAPSLTGQAGSMVTVLDAVLVNGFGSVSVTSINRTSGVATVVSAAHGLKTGDVATIAGAAQTEYNGNFVVTVVSSTSFTFDVTGTPTTPATGTITVKRASAGFTKAFSGTNKAVYRSNDVTGNRYYLRILDDGGSTAGGGECRARGYETMSDVDTGGEPFPTVGQSADGYFWRKSASTDATARPWIVITDGKIFYLFMWYNDTALVTATAATHTGAFGDFLSYKPGDVYNTLVTGNASANSSSSSIHGLGTTVTTISNNAWASGTIATARNYTGVLGARLTNLYASGRNSAHGGETTLDYPHQVDNGFYQVPTLIVQGSPAAIRGRLPGFYEGLHGRCFNNLDMIDNIQGLSGRKFMMIYTQGSSTQGHCLVDITGPWSA